MTLNFPPHVHDTARRTATRFAGRYPHLLDREDLEQDLLVACMTDARDIAAMDVPLLVEFMKGKAWHLMSKQRKRNNILSEDQATYTQREVATLLPFVFHGTDEFTGGTDATENARALVADVASAFNTVSPEDQRILRLRFEFDLSYEQIGEELTGDNKGTAHRAVARAVGRVVRALQGEPPTWVRPTKRDLAAAAVHTETHE